MYIFTYQTGAVHTDYYHDSDLTIGSVINIWGRKLLICDCDEFTKEYYKSKYGIGKLTQIDLDWFYLTNYIILKLVELLYKELKLNKTRTIYRVFLFPS